jgi:hypothetical protein
MRLYPPMIATELRNRNLHDVPDGFGDGARWAMAVLSLTCAHGHEEPHECWAEFPSHDIIMCEGPKLHELK